MPFKTFSTDLIEILLATELFFFQNPLDYDNISEFNQEEKFSLLNKGIDFLFLLN